MSKKILGREEVLLVKSNTNRKSFRICKKKDEAYNTIILDRTIKFLEARLIEAGVAQISPQLYVCIKVIEKINDLKEIFDAIENGESDRALALLVERGIFESIESARRKEDMFRKIETYYWEEIGGTLSV